jgi:hypothetical protein
MMRWEGIPKLGIHSAFFKDASQELVIGFSAKILLDNYLAGISINTIEQALDNFNKNSPFKLHKAKTIENISTLALRCDSTQNLRPEYDNNMCLDSLLIFGTNPKCDVKRYSNKKNQGIVFDNSIQREKRRLIAYIKQLELLHGNKATREFLAACNNGSKLIADAAGILRIEQNHSTYESMRERFNISSNSLHSILTAESNVNYDFLRRVAAKSKNINFDIDVRSMSWSNKVRHYGILKIIEQNHYDWNLIAAEIECSFKNRTSASTMKTKVRNIYNQLMQSRFKKKNSLDSRKINNHILELIKKSKLN